MLLVVLVVQQTVKLLLLLVEGVELLARQAGGVVEVHGGGEVLGRFA